MRLYRYVWVHCMSWGSAWGYLRWPKAVAVLLRWATPPRAQLLTAPQPQRRARRRPSSPEPRKRAQTGREVGVPTFIRPAKGLSEEIQHRVPLPHTTLARWGPGNYSLITSAGPQADPGKSVGSSLGCRWQWAILRFLQGEQSRCSPRQLLPEADDPSHPGPDLRAPWPLTRQNFPESDPRLTSTLLGTQLGAGRVGWGLGQSPPDRPCTSPCGGPGTGSPGSGWLLPPGHSPHLFSMSICTLWTRSRAIRRISWAS